MMSEEKKRKRYLVAKWCGAGALAAACGLLVYQTHQIKNTIDVINNSIEETDKLMKDAEYDTSLLLAEMNYRSGNFLVAGSVVLFWNDAYDKGMKAGEEIPVGGSLIAIDFHKEGRNICFAASSDGTSVGKSCLPLDNMSPEQMDRAQKLACDVAQVQENARFTRLYCAQLTPGS